MNKRILQLLLLSLLGCFAGQAFADSPTCVNPEKKLSWPATNPIWEMCWLPPSQSVGPDGSSLELRNIHFKGHLVMRRAHEPLLFAEYQSSTCYRDWKDANADFLSDRAVQNKLGISVDPPRATTSCDRSKDPVDSYGDCPFQLNGYPNSTATCASGVAIEDGGDRVTLTTQHSAAWYQYTSRWTFHSDGAIEPQFGFGNNDGTNSSITHWHHNYWRMEWAIDDAVNAVNTISVNGVDQTVEFSDLRNATGGPGGTAKTWEVRNQTTGNGYKLVPSADDYTIPTDESRRGFHTIDVMATKQHNGEYGDRSDNPLGVCAMNQNALVNGESLVNTSLALYYRVSVRDATNNNWPLGCSGASCIPQDSMVCKKRGPTLVPFGPWADSTPTNPAATIAPNDVQFTVDAGATATDTFGITNSGDPGSSLNYTIDLAPTSCANPGPVAWLSAAPTSGGVAQGATAPITATINAASLAPGDYSAFICVHSNDPANALISVPVGATVNEVVSPTPTAAISSSDLSFEIVEGADGSGSISIGNSGASGSTLDYALTLSSSSPANCASPDSVSWLSVAPTSGSVAAGATPANIAVNVDTTGLAVGNHAATVCIGSNDPLHATLEVPVSVSVLMNDVIFENGFESVP